jgi:hypothetical protein
VDEPIWSRHFAGEVAKILGFPMPESAPDGRDDTLRQEGERLLAEITEAFRYLPGEPFNWTINFAHFLRAREIGEAGNRPYGWPVDKLREVREYAQFLRERHGTALPADEKDYWTEEDERDFALQAWNRLEEEDPWPEDDTYRPKEE